jgi:hypothetical protein
VQIDLLGQIGGVCPLRDVSFGFAVIVKLRGRLCEFPRCCLCRLHMHQPLPTISAMLGQEPIKCEATKVEPVGGH